MQKIKPIDVNLEASLLNVMSHRDNYEKYIEHIDLKRVLPNTSILLKDYKKYFDIYKDQKAINFGDFFTHFSQNWHTRDLEAHDIDYYRDYVFPTILSIKDGAVEDTINTLL